MQDFLLHEIRNWGGVDIYIPPIREKYMIDAGRKYDLEELYNLRKNAKNAMERERFEKVADKIMRENGAVREVREKLIKAVRGNDIRAIKRFNYELRKIQADQTYGHDY